MRGYLGVRGRERGGRGLVRLVAVAASLTIAGSLAPAGAQSQAGRYREDDRSITALNIIPPGQKGVFNGAEAILAQGGTYPPHAVDQLDMYRDLRRASREDLSQLDRYFKDASFGVAEGQVERDYSPRAGVRILRDKAFGIPHIYGATRGDVMFATGYVTAEDRLFLMDTMRHLGRGRVSEFLGASDANLAMDRAMYAVAGYDDADLQKMMEDSMARYPAEGKMVLDDFNNFAAGANTYINEALTDPTKMPAEYLALQMVPQDWVPLDSMAVGTVIGAQLGVAGGDEIRNASLLLELTRAYGQEEGRKIFEDLRERDDPESPMHTTKRFPYMERGTVDPASVAMPDDPSKVGASQPIAQDHIDGPRGPIRLQTHPSMSNAVVVGGGLTASGRPMAVMGPQVAYWSPEVLIEMDLHGPGIEVRGTAFPGISAYVLMGRGRDYAWSATSSIGDMVDIFAEKLCEPDGKALTTESASYIHNGKCEPMFQRTDTFVAKPSAGGMPSGPNVMVTMKVERTVHGIVQARGTVGGKPVAFVRARTSYFKEVDSAMGFILLNNSDAIRGPEDFRHAAQYINHSFQWFFLNGDHIAYQMAGTYPVRAPGVDPDLPVWGTGEWDWRGVVPADQLPWDIDPPKGYITSWNNKQAPGWNAADGNYSFGPVHRVQMLNKRLEALIASGNKITLPDAVWVASDASTVDLRGQEVLPLLLDVLGKPPDELSQAQDLLRGWADAGAHRLDRTGDGHYDQAPAVALMDAWWPKAVHAVFDPVMKDKYGYSPMAFDNPPGALGSAYQFGYFGYLSKDLRRVLGWAVKGTWHRTYCGSGDLAACRDALASSLREAVKQVSDAYGADSAKWDSDAKTEDQDRIQFSAVGVVNIPAIEWQNRPTFQQVVEFSAPGRGSAVSGTNPAKPLPATGRAAGAGLVALVLGVIVAGMGARKHLLPRS